MGTEPAWVNRPGTVFCELCATKLCTSLVFGFKDRDEVYCKACAKAKHRRDLWDVFSKAAPIVITMHDRNWKLPNSEFERRLIRLSHRYYPELITLLKVDDKEQIIRVGPPGDRPGVTSYDDLVRRLRRPWREACYDPRQWVAGSPISRP